MIQRGDNEQLGTAACCHLGDLHLVPVQNTMLKGHCSNPVCIFFDANPKEGMCTFYIYEYESLWSMLTKAAPNKCQENNKIIDGSLLLAYDVLYF